MLNEILQMKMMVSMSCMTTKEITYPTLRFVVLYQSARKQQQGTGVKCIDLKITEPLRDCSKTCTDDWIDVLSFICLSCLISRDLHCNKSRL